MKKRSYGLIGDVHGQAPELIRLLEKLSYKKVNGVWQHVNRMVVFLGDFIDRGIHQKEVIDIVRPMENINNNCLVNYDQHKKMLFIGHYWLNNTTSQLTSNIACVDYSAANENGKLVAYQWNGENSAVDDNFVSIARM